MSEFDWVDDIPEADITHRTKHWCDLTMCTYETIHYRDIHGEHKHIVSHPRQDRITQMVMCLDTTSDSSQSINWRHPDHSCSTTDTFDNLFYT